jgi:hypothetical protein
MTKPQKSPQFYDVKFTNTFAVNCSKRTANSRRYVNVAMLTATQAAVRYTQTVAMLTATQATVRYTQTLTRNPHKNRKEAD